jgi:hypothetical protein
VATVEQLRISRIASLTIANALIFQEVVAGRDANVRTLQSAIDDRNPIQAVERSWTYILENIDYVPIFHLAREILRTLAGMPGFEDALVNLAHSAQRITARRAALRHDLMGRIYHRLLADPTRKFFGAFYTTIPAASLLLKLALPSEAGRDWSDPEAIRALRIADLACGTGTLLKAAVQTIADNHVHARAAEGRVPDLDAVHKGLVESAIWGFDVLEFAIHLAGSALALHDPNTTFGEMNLRTMTLGFDPNPRLGSLDFLGGREAEVQADLFGGDPGGPVQVTGAGTRTAEVTVPDLDLCVMNPPFTRSVGGNLLFGNLPRAQRNLLQARLRRIVGEQGIAANITAGLAPVFAALGHQMVKPGGRMALVIPRAILTGVAWDLTRQLIGNNYHLEFIIVSHQPGRWNFSENTSLSECMLVARRLAPRETAGNTKFINLWMKPSNSIEAILLADAINQVGGTLLSAATGVDELRLGDRKFGEIVLAPPEQIRAADWGQQAAFARTELARAAYHLRRRSLAVPGHRRAHPLPMARLGDFAAVGPDRRDIHDGFTPTETATAYPAVWGHNAAEVRTLAQQPNRFLAARARAAAGRNLRDANTLWARSGRLLVAERLRLNTIHTVAIRVGRYVLSNTWWPVRFDIDGVPSEQAEKVMALWFNSTLGILSVIAARVDTEGAWVDIKKPILEELMVLDPRALNERQRRALVSVYDEAHRTELLPLTELAHDPGRIAIDEALMTALGLDADLTVLRELLAEEPIFERALAET